MQTSKLFFAFGFIMLLFVFSNISVSVAQIENPNAIQYAQIDYEKSKEKNGYEKFEEMHPGFVQFKNKYVQLRELDSDFLSPEQHKKITEAENSLNEQVKDGARETKAALLGSTNTSTANNQ